MGVVGRAGAPEPVEVKPGLLVSLSGLCAKQKESALSSLILRTVSIRAWGGVRPEPRTAAYDLSWRLRTYIGAGRCVEHAFDVLLSTQEAERSSGAVCRTRPHGSQVKSTTNHPGKCLDRDPSHWLWSRGSMVLLFLPHWPCRTSFTSGRGVTHRLLLVSRTS